MLDSTDYSKHDFTGDPTLWFEYTSYKIVSAELIGGCIEIVKQYPSNSTFTSVGGGALPDKVVKEIYCAIDDRIKLVKTIEGKHTPSEHVPESIEFEEENNLHPVMGKILNDFEKDNHG